jgi:hypothetical protein
VWALLPRTEAEGFKTAWEREYRRQYDHKSANFFLTDAGPPLLRLTG